MVNKLYITENEKEIILSILTGNYEVLFLGSRVSGKHKPMSDLDICLRGKEIIPIEVLADLRAAFEDSNIPFRIDIIDWARTSSDFQNLIEKTCINSKDIQ